MEKINEYKCPCCNAGIVFDSNAQKLRCPYCDTEFDVADFAAYDDALNNDGEDSTSWKTQTCQWTDWDKAELVEYSCPSCGGTIICDTNTAATSCPFCDNPAIIMSTLSGSLKPDLVIPFKLSREKAQEAYLEHIKKRPLLPKAFSTENKVTELKGIYVPFWIFNTDSSGRIRLKGTKIRHWSDSHYNYTEKSYFSITRAGTMAFTNLPVDASTIMPDDLMDSLEPFDMSEAVDFQTAFLSGFFADKYDVDTEQCRERANTRIKNTTISVLRSTVSGYSTLHVESSNVNFDNGDCKYAMYPVWLMTTKWNDKQYIFAMNGQTGKFVGNLPVDIKKYIIRFLLFALGFSMLALLIISIIINL